MKLNKITINSLIRFVDSNNNKQKPIVLFELLEKINYLRGKNVKKLRAKLINVNVLFERSNSKEEKNQWITKLTEVTDNRPLRLQILKLIQVCDQILNPTLVFVPNEVLYLILSHLNPERTIEGQKRMQGLARVNSIWKYLIGSFHYSCLTINFPSKNKERLLALVNAPNLFSKLNIEALRSGTHTKKTLSSEYNSFALHTGVFNNSPTQLYTLQDTDKMRVCEATTGEAKQTVTMPKNYSWLPHLYSHRHKVIVEDGCGIYLHDIIKQTNHFIKIVNTNNVNNYKSCQDIKFLNNHLYFADDKGCFFKTNLNTLNSLCQLGQQHVDCSKYRWNSISQKLPSQSTIISAIHPTEWRGRESIIFGLDNGHIGLIAGKKKNMFFGAYRHQNPISSIQVSDQRAFSIAKEEKQLIMWDLETKKSLFNIKTESPISCFKIVDLEHLIIATVDGRLMMIQVIRKSKDWDKKIIWSKNYQKMIHLLEIDRNKLYVSSESLLDILSFEEGI